MSKLFEYLKQKRNSLLSGGKRSQKACNILDSIRTKKKGEFIKIPVHDERDAHNVRVWLSNNRKHLNQETMDIRTIYKREESILYVYIN